MSTTPTVTATPTPTPAPTKPTPGSPEWNAAMAAKFDNTGVTADASADTQVPAPAAKTKPEGVPDKFWNAEKGEVDVAGLSKSYTELERTRTDAATKTAKDTADKAATDAKAKHAEGKAKLEADLVALKAKQGVTPAEIAAAEKALAEYPTEVKTEAPQAQPKVELAKITEEFQRDGKISDASYAKLAEIGLDRNSVDLYMRGLDALSREYNGKVFTAAGGETQYKAMVEWAKTGLNGAEQKAFDEAVTSGDEAKAVLAAQGLQAKFTAANGKQPNLLGGGRPGASTEGFRSTAEMTEAMKDPRYKKDPAYRADVERRVAASTAF